MFSSICKGYVTVIFMYIISTVHNPDRQNYKQENFLRDTGLVKSTIFSSVCSSHDIIQDYSRHH